MEQREIRTQTVPVWEQYLLALSFPIITRWEWGGPNLSKCLPRSRVRSVLDGYMNK